MSLTINGATNTITGAAGLAIAANTAVTGTLSATGITSVTNATDATSTTAASLTTAGGLGVAKKLYVGDNIVMASGKGIDFSATANGSGTMTSEVLSDYEEGTWTPGFTFVTPGDLAVTYTTQTGKYNKIGRLVTVTFEVNMAAGFTHTTAAGIPRITGLPFTASGSISSSLVSFQGITMANYTAFGLSTSATNLDFSGSASAQGNVNLSAANMPSGGTPYLKGQATYIV